MTTVINGERLKQARDFQGLSQTELAERVGVSQSTIAYIESGRLAPSEAVINAISMGTGFPPAFFRQELTTNFPLGSLLYRSRSSATVAQKTRAHRFAEFTFELVQHLTRRVKLLPVRLPRIDGTPLIAAGATRSALGLSPDKPISNLLNALERAGVIIVPLPSETESIDAFSLWAGENMDRPIIALASNKPPDRIRLTLAHELAHLVMHQAINGDLSELEDEARDFASEFLMPEAVMKQQLTAPVTLTSLSALKPRWGVSIQALAVRAHRLGIISDRQHRYLHTQIRGRGWRVNEPGSSQIPLERPRVIRQMTEMVYGDPIPYKKMSTDTHLPRPFIEMVMELCLPRFGDGVSTPRPSSSPKVISFSAGTNHK